MIVQRAERRGDRGNRAESGTARARAWVAGAITAGGAAMLVAAAAQNGGNLAFHALASQVVGSSRYGALGALLTLTVALSIPLGALQVAVTRSVAETGAGADTRRVLARVARYSILGGTLVVLAAPLIGDFLRLGSVWQAVPLGPYLVVAAVDAALRGAAIGRGHAREAAASLVAGTFVRLLVGIPAIAWAGITGALLASIVSELVAIAIVVGPAAATTRGEVEPRFARSDILETSAVMLGVWLLASVDVLLARHYLAGAASSLYVAAGTAARAVLFLPQALCAVAVARFAARSYDGSAGGLKSWRMLRDTLIVSGVLCAVAAGCVALFGPALLAVAFGIHDPESSSVLLWLALGTFPATFAIVLSTYHLGRRSRLAFLPWIGALGEVVTIAVWHGSPVTVARAAIVGSLLHTTVACGVLVRERRLAFEQSRTARSRGTTSTNDRPLRILILNWRDLTHPSSGGAERYVDEIARRWVSQRHRVTLFCAAVADRPERETIAGVEIIRRGTRFGVYHAARRFWDTEGRGHYDLVIDCINTKPFAAVRFVDTAPVIALAHQVAREVWWYEAPLPVAVVGRFVLEPTWLRRYRNVPVLTVSASSRDALRHYGITRVSIVPEGVDIPRRALPPKAARPTIVYCGRLVRSKRPHHAIAAFAQVRRTITDARLVVIGSGPMHGRLQQGAPPGVEFVGRVSEAERNALMASAHALVVTSVREGWGLVVSEAAVLGTPAVAYDVPGLRDSVAAAGGRLSGPTPTDLARVLTESLPSWMDDPPPPVPFGGARSWDDVAEVVLAKARAMTGLASRWTPMPPPVIAAIADEQARELVRDLAVLAPEVST